MNRWPSPSGARARAAWILLAWSLVALLGGACRTTGPRGLARPVNVVVFYVDDLGWRDVGFQGSRFYDTPHLDALAAEGLVFTDAYSNGPNCAPSRACLMTGLWTPRHGVYTVNSSARGKAKSRRLVPVENRRELDGSFTTLAEALAERGYATAHVGKWHLGADPREQGFDVNIGGSTWGTPPGGHFAPYKNHALPDGPRGESLTDRLTADAVEWIDGVAERGDAPFFLYLAHYAVHTPIQADPERAARFAERAPDGGQRNAKYAAMIERVDESLGRVRAALAERGLSEDTLIVFTSDNGGHGGVTSNAPLRGAKGMLYEGGVRVPLAIAGPGVRSGACSAPVSGIDLTATVLELAGAAGRATDGRSLAPLLADAEAAWPERALFWHFPAYLEGGKGAVWRTTPAGSIRRGRFKLIEFFETGAVELYDLSTDPSEARDLARELPERAAALHAELRAWRTAVDAAMPTKKEDA